MIRYIPPFILNNHEQQNYCGAFTGYVLFLDIADFTSLCNVFRKEGKKGAEALSCFLTEVLSYPIEQVESFGGFISLFAGDAICAVFPEGDSNSVRHVVDSIGKYFTERDTFETSIGSFQVKVRLTATHGEINWKIFCNDKQCEYVFYGKPLVEMVKLTDQKEAVALSDEVKTAFARKVNTTPTEKHLSYPFSSETEKAFIHSRLTHEQPENEIRDAAYCFADLSRIEEDKQEAAISLIHTKLDDYSGFLNKLDATDKGLVALILFGLPKSVGNTLDRLCRFALEITEAIPELSLGLSCGTTYTGFIGSESTREYTALGTAVNLAARLMQKAGAGEILTDNYLQQDMRYKYSFTPDEAISLKGFVSEVHSSRLIERLLVLSNRFQTSFVGREQEIGYIKAQIMQEGSRIIYVMGESGTGKSRLIFEALKEYPEYYFMFCDPSGHRILEPIKQFLRKYFNIDNMLSNQRNLELYRRQWQELAGDDKELIRIESIIASLLGYDWEGSVWSVLPPEEKPEQQKNAFATLFNHITSKDRIIIHLDDPQWIDNTSLEFLQQLGKKKVQNVTIVAACKDNDDGTSVDLGITEWKAEYLELHQIDKDASETIIRQVLQADTLPPKTLEWIAKKADGNPLFLEQAVAYLKENDNFDESFQLKGDFEHISSFGIGDIIGSRIDSLTENVRHTLQHACVLGLEFNTRILSEMLSRKLDDDLGAGKQAKVWADIDELRYIFTHILIKDTAYSRMMNEKLKQLHLLAAEAMEKLYQEDENTLNEHAEEIAIHFHKAEDEITAAKYYDMAGVYFTKNYNFDDAEKVLQMGLDIREVILGNRHPDTAATLNNLASLYGAQGENDKAEQLLLRALKISEDYFGNDSIDNSGFLHNLASVLDDLGKYEQAELFYLKALTIREKILGIEHPETATSIDNLAVLYYHLGKYEQAESNYLKALTIREKVLGMEHYETALTLNNLGSLYRELCKYDLAEQLFTRALRIMEKTLGSEHPVVATIMNNLAVLYYHVGQDTQSEFYYLRSLAIREKILGLEHPQTAITLNSLAVLYKQLGKSSIAESMYLKALGIYESLYGQVHLEIATTLNNLALLYIDQQEYDLAEPLMLRALSIREKIVGVAHVDFSYSLNSLALMYFYQGKYEEAESFFQRALDIQMNIFGEEHDLTATILNNLATLYQKQYKYNDAERLCSRALIIREKILGGEHLDTTITMNDLAVLYMKQGKYKLAEPLCVKALEIREISLGINHPNTALFLHNLATLYNMQCRCFEAETLYLRAYSIRQKTLGVKHPNTQKSIEALVETYEKLNQPDKAAEYQAMLIDSEKDKQ